MFLLSCHLANSNQRHKKQITLGSTLFLNRASFAFCAIFPVMNPNQLLSSTRRHFAFKANKLLTKILVGDKSSTTAKHNGKLNCWRVEQKRAPPKVAKLSTQKIFADFQCWPVTMETEKGRKLRLILIITLR